MAKYVTLENLTAFAAGLVTKITEKFVAKESGKGLSSNDYTAAEKTKLAGITDMKGATASAAGSHGLVPAPAAGKQASFLRGDGTWAVPAGGQANVIEVVKVNNTALPVTSKAVNIDLSSYALKADITEATTADIDNIINGLFV
nr:MAG TPA: hypothetical protein [Caudoviricetes sp.]